MKTSIKTIFTLAIATVILGSCRKDFLDKINRNEPVEQTFWTSAENAESAIPTVYSSLRGQMYGYFGAYTGFQTMNRADDIWFILGEEVFNWQYGTYHNTPNTSSSDFGRLYSGVNRANVFLKNIQNVKMDADKKNQFIGEVSFLRGLYYFLLVTNYGDVPLRLVPAGDDPDGVMKSSSPAADVWQQVIADFTTAKQYLPVTRPSSEKGRATKGAAIAYLGKSLVYTEQYTQAETELSLLLNAPYTYDLVDDPDNNLNENTEFNTESVFEIYYDGGFGSGSWGSESSTSTMGFVIPNFVGSSGTGGWFKFMPNAAIIEDFIAEKRPAGSDTRFDKRMYTNFFWKYSDYESGLTDGAWFGNQSFDEMWTNASGKRQRGEPVYPIINGETGRFLIKKFTNFWKNIPNANSHYDQSNQNQNYRLMRFAEVLLLHAEACIKNGNLPDAEKDLDRIRERAGLANITWGSAEEMMQEVRHQNELEFFFEGHRFFDLKRWFDYDEMKQILIDNKKQGAEDFLPKHYVLPIPESEINANSVLTQNPLWQ